MQPGNAGQVTMNTPSSSCSKTTRYFIDLMLATVRLTYQGTAARPRAGFRLRRRGTTSSSDRNLCPQFGFSCDTTEKPVLGRAAVLDPAATSTLAVLTREPGYLPALPA